MWAQATRFNWHMILISSLGKIIAESPHSWQNIGIHGKLYIILYVKAKLGTPSLNILWEVTYGWYFGHPSIGVVWSLRVETLFHWIELCLYRSRYSASTEALLTINIWD